MHSALEPRGNVVGEQEWVSLTPPCCLKNATGMETSFALAFAAFRVIDPKYCWLAASPSPLIVIVSNFVFPAGIVKFEGDTEIDPPAGATVWTENDWFDPLTFRAVRVVVTCPDIVGALMLGVFAWIRLSGAAARAAYCAAVTSNVSVGRVARLARIDPAPVLNGSAGVTPSGLRTSWTDDVISADLI